ncbi:unnamed protein product [Fusarium graminearum]|uniref:C2H2-type domain-containing protein n=1 Tax=Gibberella zeae TaxID=5518 RepID=A0A9N8RKN9_GIBZA|nr:unnamed protein product [Fusarium graminearum]
MEHNQQSESIASHVAKTFESFRDLEDALAETTIFHDSSEGAILKAALTTIENDLIRFKMWVGNQAAHQSGPSSLDYRLREAPHLQQQVIYLLKDICESLEDASNKASGGSDSCDQAQRKKRDQNTQDNDTSSVDSAQDEESDFSDSDPDVEDDATTVAISTPLLDVGEAIDCLLRLSVAIANPAPHERFQKSGAEDISFYEKHDIAYVKDKFPKLDSLASVLGRSITRRRQFFKYRHAHHEKLASGIETMASNEVTDTCHTEVIPETIASSLPENFKMMAKFDPQAAVIDEESRSDTAMSQTSYATSAGFIFERTDQETCEPVPPLRVPPRPSAATNGIFECPFCYRMTSARTRAAWKRHVFGDLRPYTCVFPDCAEFNTDFHRRHDWQLHVSKFHWRSWTCPFRCQQPFSSNAELSNHIKYHHLQTGTDGEIKSVTALGEKPAPDDTSSHCVLCGHYVTGLEHYVKHVGKHLEQLALFALPYVDIVGSEKRNEDSEENSVKSGTEANNLQESSSSPSLILAPQQHPGTGLAVEVGKEEGLSNDDEPPHDPYYLSQRALGRQPARPDFHEGAQGKSELFDLYLGRDVDMDLEFARLDETGSWRCGSGV